MHLVIFIGVMDVLLSSVLVQKVKSEKEEREESVSYTNNRTKES